VNRTAIRYTRWASGALCLALFFSSGLWAQAADLYGLCGIDQQQFSKFAYPAGVPYLSDRLVKWRQPPGLIVLSPHAELEGASKRLFEQVGNDGLQAGSPVKFVHYATPDEIYNVTTEHGINNVFLIVDAVGFSGDQRTKELRQAVMDMLLSPPIVDRLFSTALKNQEFSIQSHVNLISGEVFSSVALINPEIGATAVSHTLYTLYYAALSPPATYRVRDFFDAMFVPPVNGGATHLSELAKAYYRVVLDPGVQIGALPGQFGECNG